MVDLSFQANIDLIAKVGEYGGFGARAESRKVWREIESEFWKGNDLII